MSIYDRLTQITYAYKATADEIGSDPTTALQFFFNDAGAFRRALNEVQAVGIEVIFHQTYEASFKLNDISVRFNYRFQFS